MLFECWDYNNVRLEIEADTAREAAGKYVDSGDWEQYPHTWWCTMYVRPAGSDEPPEQFLIPVDPVEPPCPDHQDHDWYHVATVGSGGGVRCTEGCRRCSIQRVTDTWAQDRATGIQGLHSTAYTYVDTFDHDGDGVR